MKKLFSTFFNFFCFFVILLGLGVSTADAGIGKTVCQDVIRLHVIAASDSNKDQMLKYKVRDGVLDVTNQMFSECDTVEEALETAIRNKASLKNAAEKVLKNGGCDDEVEVAVEKENYPQKTYAGLVFPQGEYLSVKVIIGEGKGKNWWCVLFPPLCNSGTENADEVIASYGIDKKELQKLKNKAEENSFCVFGCRIKLKFLDYFN